MKSHYIEFQSLCWIEPPLKKGGGTKKGVREGERERKGKERKREKESLLRVQVKQDAHGSYTEVSFRNSLEGG